MKQGKYKMKTIIKKGFIKINEKNTEYFFIKNNETHKQQDILFVHGANHGAWCWNIHFLEYFFEKGFNVYSINLFNHGNSSKLDNVSLDIFEEQLRDFIKKLNLDPILIAHSVGTAVVQKYIMKESTKCKVCILLAPVAPWGMKYDFFTKLVDGIFQKIKLFLYNLKVIKKYPVHLFVASDNITIDNCRFVPESNKVCKQCFKPLMDIYKKKYYFSILILGSRNDKVINKKTIYKMSEYYQAQYKIYENIGHDMMLDKGWDEVAKDIFDFLRLQGG